MTDYSSKPEILIIDDDTEICETLELLINSLGYYVRYFTNPNQGLEYFESTLNPIVILDVNMPNASGLDLLPMIKKISHKTQVLMMTGERDIQMVLSSLQNRATDFILKPFQMQAVEASIQHALGLFQILTEKEETEISIQDDLKLAGLIQNQLMSSSASSEERLFLKILPLQYVSGDFIHIVTQFPGYSYILIGDVEEHGVSSGLIGIYITTIFKEMIKNKSVSSPKEVLTILNHRLCQEVGKFSMTATCAFVNHKQGEVVYSRAGHPFPIVFPSLTKEAVVYNEPLGSILGVIPDSSYQDSKLETQIGDVLFLYSDGLLSSTTHPLVNTLCQLPLGEDRIFEMQKQIEVYVSYLQSSAKVKDDISYCLLEI